jgi:hypothetical protein
MTLTGRTGGNVTPARRETYCPIPGPGLPTVPNVVLYDRSGGGKNVSSRQRGRCAAQLAATLTATPVLTRHLINREPWHYWPMHTQVYNGHLKVLFPPNHGAQVMFSECRGQNFVI